MLGFRLLEWSLAGAGHAFAEAAFPEEIQFQAPELLVEQVAGDFDQTRDNVGANGRIGMLDGLLEGLLICAGCAVESAQAPGVGVVGCLLLDATVAHEVAEIFQKFLLAGLSDAGELDFCSILQIAVRAL